MDKNVKIAKELVKLAKSLMAEENVANQPGHYENFTGRIQYKDSFGTVTRATFELKDDTDESIVWKNGIWERGAWHGGIWEKGHWENGIWWDGTWKKGTWSDGKWLGGTWENGEWLSGTWKGGIWKTGRDSNMEVHLKGDSPDKWNE